VYFDSALVVLVQKQNVCVAVRRWFDSGEDDGLIERELDVVLYVQTPPPPPPCDRSGLGPYSSCISFYSLA